MAKKVTKPVMGLDTRDPQEVRAAFLAMRVRTSQAVSRASRAIRECHRLESHVNLLNMQMQVARASLIALQKDLDEVLKGIENARRAELRSLN